MMKFRFNGVKFIPCTSRVIWCFAALIWAAPAFTQISQFRAVGGPGMEFGKFVFPHQTGAFLVANSRLDESNILRGYLVHYDSNLNVDWSILLPFDGLLQEVVDAWVETPGMVNVLTRDLTPDIGYETHIHTVDSTGVWHGKATLASPLNFRPVIRVNWLGENWVVGGNGSQPAAVNVATGDIRTWGGLPGTSDEVTDALVTNNMLIAVGSRTAPNTTHTAIWGMYPLGQLAFEIIQPDSTVGEWSEADAVAVQQDYLSVLQSYHPQVDSTGSLLHNILALNPTTGELNGIIEGPQSGQRPGRDLIWTNDGMLKLSQTDAFTQLDESMLLTHYTPNGGFIDQGAWGTTFEDDPSHITVGPGGSIWVAGSTRGTLDGSWNACLLRLDSLGPLGSWSSETPDLGLFNDPLFDYVSVVQPVAGSDLWSCFPNPAAEQTRLSPSPDLDNVDDSKLEWTLYDVQGRTVSNGVGPHVNLIDCNSGVHMIRVSHLGRIHHLNLLVRRP